MSQKNMSQKNNSSQTGKILLVLCPYWTPLIPPLGISCLKSYLGGHGYDVKTVDINIIRQFSDLKNEYFQTLQSAVPEDCRGNFLNIGNDVLRNHMMAHLHSKGEKDYSRLINIIVQKTFYNPIDASQVVRLDDVIRRFFAALETYLLRLLEEEKPALFGVSVYKGTLPASLFAFKLVKQHFPHITTVMGGGIFADQLNVDSPDFSGFLEQTPYIDTCIIGEGELLFLKLLRRELPPHKKAYSLPDIEGETVDLSLIGDPDFSDLNVRYYPNLASFGSRSCPFQCGFCSETVQWGRFRKRPVDQIVNDTITQYRKYNRQLFLMGDSLLNPVASVLSQEYINRGTVIYWDGYLRADREVCDPDTTLLWRRGGFYRARLGLESGSPRVLAAMGKKVSVEQIKSALHSLANAGIKTTTYWVIGYPGETEDDFMQTLALIDALKNDIYEAECNPFNYFPTGQVNSSRWEKENKALYLYPPEAKDALIVSTWTLDCEPSRQETYRRVRHFVKHCRREGIPNPYSMAEINQADQRWQKLHKNAVPPLVNFVANETAVDECRNIKKIIMAQHNEKEDKSFVF